MAPFILRSAAFASRPALAGAGGVFSLRGVGTAA